MFLIVYYYYGNNKKIYIKYILFYGWGREDSKMKEGKKLFGEYFILIFFSYREFIFLIVIFIFIYLKIILIRVLY